MMEFRFLEFIGLFRNIEFRFVVLLWFSGFLDNVCVWCEESGVRVLSERGFLILNMVGMNDVGSKFVFVWIVKCCDEKFLLCL